MQILVADASEVPSPYELCDISDGGLCFEGSSPLPAGKVIDVEFQTPEGDMRLRAEVVWAKERAEAGIFGIGCKYEPLGHVSKVRLQRFLATLPVGDQTPVRRKGGGG